MFLGNCEAVQDVQSIGPDVLRFKFDASLTPKEVPDGVFFKLDDPAF